MKIQELKLRVEDFRDAQGKIYPLKSLFYPLLYGIALGLRSVLSIYQHCEASFSKPIFKKLGMNNFKLASQRSFYRAFHGFNLSFNQETQEFARCILHLDGKSLRGSQDEAGMITHIVNLWDDENSILVGQEATKIGTGAGCERAAAAALLEKTDVRGDIITGDAGFSSGNFPQKI
ncbi:MAG: hypothetical protein AAF621_08290, partial [Pseudomonadota bacterium]